MQLGVLGRTSVEPITLGLSQRGRLLGAVAQWQLRLCFSLLVYWDSGWYGVPYFRCRPRVCLLLQHDDTHGT